MKQKAEALRRQIALYRSYLTEGIDAELARKYLLDIKVLEAELASIEGAKKA